MRKTFVLNQPLTRSQTRACAPRTVVEEVYVPLTEPVRSRSLFGLINWNWLFNPSQWVCALLALILLNLLIQGFLDGLRVQIDKGIYATMKKYMDWYLDISHEHRERHNNEEGKNQQ